MRSKLTRAETPKRKCWLSVMALNPSRRGALEFVKATTPGATLLIRTNVKTATVANVAIEIMMAFGMTFAGFDTLPASKGKFSVPRYHHNE